MPAGPRRRRWCDSVLEAPASYRQLLAALSQQHVTSSPEALKLLSQLAAFSSRPYHHGDPDPIKAITAAADQLAAACPADSPDWQQCMQALLELLFMRSSRPLHKQLLSFVRKLGPAHQQVVGQVLVGSVTREAAAVLLAGSPSQQQKQQQEGAVPLQQAMVLSPAVAAAVLAAPPRLPAAAVSRGFELAQAAISLLQMPAARAWLQPAGPLLLLAIARSIQSTLDPQQQQQQPMAAAVAGEQAQQHLTAKTIELVQDSINVMYMVLQYHGQHIAAAAATAANSATAGVAEPPAGATAGGEQGELALASVCEAAQSMLCALQGSLVVREALASAAVVVWSAAILPAVPPTAAALAIAAGLTPGQLPPGLAAAAAAVAGGSARAQQLLGAWRGSSLLEQQLAQQGRSLVAELQQAPHVARVCALRGLLAAMPAAALAGDLGVSLRPAVNGNSEQAEAASSGSSSSSSGYSFIMRCALPFALEAARDAPDAHFKFFAMSLLASVLEGAAQLWGNLQEQQLQLAAPAAADSHDTAGGADGPDAATAAAAGSGEGGGRGAGDSRADVLVVPWLSSTDAQAVMALLSSHLDEPVAQVLAKVQESFEALLTLIKVQHDSAEKLHLQPPALNGSNTAAAAAAAAASGNATTSSTGAAGGAAELDAPMLDADRFLQDTAQSVLALGASRKGRYQPLTALLPHIGSQALLQLQPGLVAETIDAMQTNACASAAAGFFRALLLQLRTELPTGKPDSSTPAAAGAAGVGADILLQHMPAAMRPWCSCWLPEVLTALWAQGERARTYVANYALPMVLQAEPLLLQPMVDTILAAHTADADAGAGGGQAAAAGAGSAESRQALQGCTGRRDAAAALVVVLRVARRLQLVGNLDILLPHQQEQQQQEGDSSSTVSPAGLLLSAVSSATAGLRIEALELVCVSARTTAPPGVLELLVAQRWLTLCLRCTGADSRHKSLALWEKLLARQAAAVRAIRHRAAVANTPGATGGAHPKALPRAPRSLLSAPPGTAPAPAESDAEAEQRQLVFLSWLSRTLLDSLYPGGPYERKYFALELMAVLLQQWLHADPSSGTAGMPVRKGQHKPTAAVVAAAAAAAAGVGGVPEPFLAGLLSPGCVQTLLGCVVDSWDKMRITAARVLQLMPAPLPGCTTPQQLLPLLSWALQLLQSPRVRESDAGARTLQLLVSKYLLGLGWTLTVGPEPSVAASAAAANAGADAATAAQCGKQQGSSGSSAAAGEVQVLQAAATFLSSLTGQLRSQLAAAQADVAAASRHGLVHGTLLCLKYTVEVLPWTTLASSSAASISMHASAAAAAACGLAGGVSEGCNGQQGEVVVVSGPVPCVLHCWVTDLAALLTAVADLVKPWLSAQDVNVAANEVEEADDDAFSDTELDGEPGDTAAAAAAAGAVGAVVDAAAAADAAGVTSAGGLSGPAVQLLISACWTSYKEASLLIGTLAARLPLPKSTAAAVSSFTPATQDSSSCLHTESAAANGTSGSHHHHHHHQQQQLIECQQLDQLGALQRSMLLSMKHNGAVEKSQAGFIALLERLLESPEACLNQLPRRWLGQCLDRVQELGQSRDDIVRRSAGLPFAICSLFLAEPVGAPRQLLPAGLKQLLDIASNEDLQEPWPRVHAFNTLRVVFNDSNMALDSSGFHAAGVVAAIDGMAAPAWEVRNAAALTFTALMLRVVGARNIDAHQQKLLKPLNQLAATPAGLHTISSRSGGGSSGGSSGSAPVGPQQQGPTAADFFSRYPQLHAFLLQQLQAAVNQQQQQLKPQQTGAASSSSSSSVETVPPSLFPSLVLLSRLRPQLLTSASQAAGTSSLAGAGAAAESGAPQGSAVSPAAAAAAAAAAAGSASALGLDPAVFVPALLAVARSPVMGVRSMAAAALTPLVPAEQLHAVCLHLADALPAAAGRDSAQRPGVPVSQNALHGSLLQLTALLSETSRGSSDSPSNAASCAALVQQLLPAFVQGGKVLAASSSTSCCAVRQAFVAAAGQLLVLAYRQWPLLLQPQQQHQPSVDVAPSAVGAGSSCVALLQQLVATLQASCLSAIQSTVPAASAGAEGAGSSVDQQDPLHSCWLRDCAALLLGPLLQLQLVLHKHAQHSTDAEVVAYQLQLLADVLPLTLTSSLYEVQAAALKAAAVQLQGVLAVCRQAHVSLSHSSSSSSAAAVRTLAACVWLALRQQQVVKVTKRLLVVWGHIQCLQQLLPDEQCVEGQQQQQQSGRYADSTGVEQLRVLLEMTEACREPEARAHALLGAARVTFELTARQQQRPAQGSAIYSSSSGSNSVDQGSGVGTGLPLDAVTRLLESFIAAHQPEHLRAAAAEALHLSGLLLPLAQGAAKHTAWSHLHTCGNTAAGTAASMDAPAQENELLPRACLDAWLLALRLMEDEDEDVRQAAAAAAQQALQLVPPALLQPLADMPAEQQQQQKQQELVGEAGGISSRSQAAAAAALAGAGAGAGAVSGLQYVAAVQCSCFALLGRCASWCPEVQPCLVQHLQQLVFPADTALPVVLQKHAHLQQQGGSGSSFVPVLPAVASGAVVQEEACVQHIQLPGVALRRLFEREADNHHEEQLLLAQHAAAALRHTLLMANPKGGCTQAQLGALLSGWCAGVVGGFLQVVAAGLTAQGCVGDVHHPEVFVPLYRCCLGLWAAAPSLSTAAAAAGQEGPSSWAQAVALLGQLSQLQLPKGLVQAVQAARDGEAVTAGSSGLLFLLQ